MYRVDTKKWFLLNLKIGSLSFGSSSRIMLYQEAVVDQNKWLVDSEYQEILTVAQLAPGPNLVNLAVYLGYKLAGPVASVAGLLGLATPGVVVILLVNAFLDLQNEHVSWLFKGFSLGSVALFLVFLYRLIKGLKDTSSKEKISRVKLAIRGLISAGVIIASLTQVPLVQILIVGILISWAMEYIL